MVKLQVIACSLVFPSVLAAAKSVDGGVNNDDRALRAERDLQDGDSDGRLRHTAHHHRAAHGPPSELRRHLSDHGLPRDAPESPPSRYDDRSAPRRPRIIGGSRAASGRFRYAVSLQDRAVGHFCGGALIAPDCVLSAA